MSDSQFDDAVSALYSSLHQARTKEALEKSAARRIHTVSDMQCYLKRLNHLTKKLPNNIIHITGTKGKGSTAAFCDSILRRRYKLNTGLFSSPHLVDIRERIRVNGKPISKEVFGKAYFDVREKLQTYPSNKDDELPQLPGYFRMLTLMALYVFANYQEPTLDAVILEVGMGGRYDATNVIDSLNKNVICGVTLLDLDHTRVLGNTLEQIAWEKGGIFAVHKASNENVTPRPSEEQTDQEKPVVLQPLSSSDSNQSKRLFAVNTNPPSVLAVLRQCAYTEGMGQELHVVGEGESIPNEYKLGLEGRHQRINAELAVHLCEALVQNMTVADMGVQDALAQASWPGRCQTVGVETNNAFIHFRCDGAHTVISMLACMDWFQSICNDNADAEKALIFNCSHERNPVPLLQILQKSTLFDTVYFCRSNTERPSMVNKSSARDLLKECGLPVDPDDDILHHQQETSWQDTLANIWKHLERTANRGSTIFSSLTVPDALERIKGRAMGDKQHEGVEVCVTGSLYIVGSLLEAVCWTEGDAEGHV